MKTKLLAFGLMFTLMFSPVLAQDEALLDDEDSSSAAPADDIFGGDFFGDIDSFLEEETTAEEAGDLAGDEPAALDDDFVEPISDTSITSAPAPAEDLQSSAQGVPGNLPSSALVALSVVNISQDNANAVTAGARPGDVLRYEISLNSPVEDVLDYVPSINVSNIQGVVEFTNTGFGVLEGGNLVYPSYSHQAPCEQVFTFFVRINEDCAEQTSITVSNSEAGSIEVPLNCGLTQTGPAQRWFLLIGLMMLLVALGFGFSSRTKTS